MNLEELEEELDNVLPSGYSIETDSRGKIVIHTNQKLVDGELVDFNNDDDEDDLDLDSDFEPLDEEMEDDE